MTDKILLGYEIGTGIPVEAKLHHLFISGVTQHSGKTTGLEAFINRAGLPALVFRTGRGELGFTNAHKIQPYFRERTDWRFLEGLLSVHLREKTKIYRSNLMTVSRGANNLQTVWDRIRRKLTGRERARGWDLKMFTELDQYFSEFMPSLGQVTFATELRLENGLNVVDLEGQPVALQQLVIAASLEYIMEKMSGVIVVVPEAYKLIPLDRPSPVRLAAEAITREGMKIKNFLWLDSQQLTGLDLDILRNVDIWLFGRQTLDREKERAARMIPGHGVSSDDIHGLTLGQFYIVQYGEKVQKIYVQPAWLDSETAVKVAKGEDAILSAQEAHKMMEARTPPEEQVHYAPPQDWAPLPPELLNGPAENPILRMARENAEGKLSGTDPLARMANLMADQQKRIDEMDDRLSAFIKQHEFTVLHAADPPVTSITVYDPATIIEAVEQLESVRVTTDTLRGQIAKIILDGKIPSQLFNATRLRTILISDFGSKAEAWDVDSILNELKTLTAPPFRLFTFDSKHRLFRLKSQAKDRVKG